MRIFFSVGEPSGDLHASNLIRRLQTHDPQIEFVGFGGPKMEAEGCQLLFELTQFAVMFLGQALKNLRFFFRLIAQADQYFAQHRVDAVVLIDYSGFNWWIARKARNHKIPVFYYGVPQVWAWGPWRIRKIRKYVDHILCKLPFEVPWFEKRGCKATYVGHPYFDQLVNQTYDESLIHEFGADPRPLLVLLPGSRTQEVVQNLPILLDSARIVAESTPTVRVAVASYNDRQFQLAKEIVQKSGVDQFSNRVELYVEKTPELMKSANVCLACSGSVSLELMYHRKPTVIVYRLQWWTMILQVFLIRVRYITLVNLIAAGDIRKPRLFRRRATLTPQTIMPEYLTSGNPAKQVAEHVIEWLANEASRQNTIDKLDDLARRFAKPGASEQAADYIFEHLGLRSHNSLDGDSDSLVEKIAGSQPPSASGESAAA